MTDEKLLEAVAALEALLPVPNEFQRTSPTSQSLLAQWAHVRTMFPRLRALVAEGRREKAMRWLGFIQGAVWAMNLTTLDALKAMNRSDDD